GPALRRPTYLTEGHVACTPFEGALRLAGTMELSGLNHRLSAVRLDAISRAAATYLRDWPGRVERPWAGLRPMTPDGLPAIGPVPGCSGAWVATGHAMLGVTLAPATGEAIAALVTGELTPQTAEL